jgi:hypothetical protein
MSSFFDSGAADLGQSLSGAGVGGLVGYIQSLQLKQQLQKQHQELMNPHVTALAHGSYLVQDPLTGEVKEHQAMGVYPGGIQNELMHRFFLNPNDPNVHHAMNFVFGNSPEKMDAMVKSLQALEAQRVQGAGANASLSDLRRAQAQEVAPTAEVKRELLGNRAEAASAGTELATARSSTESAKAGLLKRQAERVQAITQPDVDVRKELANRNEQAAARFKQQIENDQQLTPARKQLLEARAEAALEAAKRHREAGKRGGKAAPENSVTIGMDALGRPYAKPTFKKPEDAKAFMHIYQQWTQPLKNLDTGFFGNKKEALSKIRATWIEKNHPTEAEVAGFDQAMREAAQ